MDAPLPASVPPQPATPPAEVGSAAEKWPRQPKPSTAEDRRKRKLARRKEREVRWREQRKAARKDKGKTASNKARRHARKAEEQQDPPTHTVVFDMSFDDKMTDREVRSLTQQLMFCRGVNRRVKRPITIFCTGLHGKTEHRLVTAIAGYQTWKHWTYEKRDICEVFSKEKLVYLSGESSNSIFELDPDKVYVVGGIVDHNRHKGLTFRKAAELGIATAKLPIDEFLKMSTRKILAVNHVFEILVNWVETRDWATAFQRSIPKRKGAELLGDEEEGGDEDEGDEGADEDGEGDDDDGDGEDDDRDEDGEEHEQEELQLQDASLKEDAAPPYSAT